MNTNVTCRSLGKLATVLVASGFLCVGYAEDTPKKVSKAEGINAVTSKVAPDYPAIAKQLKKWKFAPFTSEGKTVKALVPISLSFHM